MAQRYAQALFEIARDLHKDDEIEAELESLSAALKSAPEIERFMANPALKTDQKRAFLKRIYQKHPPKAGLPVPGEGRVDEVLISFFSLLFEKNRFYLLNDIVVYFKKIADEAKGQGVAEIHSAVTLNGTAQKEIVNRLERLAGYKITVKNFIDPSLIGGVVVKIRNKIIDDSVKNKIHRIKKELMKIQSI